MAAHEKVAQAMLAVQKRQHEATPIAPKTPKLLQSSIFNCLKDASDIKILKDPVYEIHRKLKLTADKDTPSIVLITGGVVNGNRFRGKEPFQRDDGATIDFSIAVEETADKNVKVLGYDFLIELPRGLGPPFLRFDLNRPATDGSKHGNEVIGLRSHMHPGVNEDMLLAPAPIMTPVEILTLFLYHLRESQRIRSDRRLFHSDQIGGSSMRALQQRGFRFMSWIRLNHLE